VTELGLGIQPRPRYRFDIKLLLYFGREAIENKTYFNYLAVIMGEIKEILYGCGTLG
jgi:hypothetical protein